MNAMIILPQVRDCTESGAIIQKKIIKGITAVKSMAEGIFR